VGFDEGPGTQDVGGHLSQADSYLLQFYKRRAKRILPAFYGVLLFTILASMFLMSPHEARVFGITAVAATLSASNLLFWYHTNYFNPDINHYPLLNTWSLGVEEQFYAVVPLLMVLIARIRRLLLPAILIVCVLSFLLAWFELRTYPNNVFYLLPERAWELGVGVALALIELNRKSFVLPAPLTHLLGVVGAGMILAPMFLLQSQTVFPGSSVLASVVLGTALLIAVPASFINRWLLSLPPLVFIGKISYSLYLWHWPLLAFLHLAAGNILPPVAVLLAVAASLAAAIISYYLIEQPFRRSTRPPGPLLIR
jgi:peptidoglycan/LPS O-acetylase OafA/YrhL